MMANGTSAPLTSQPRDFAAVHERLRQILLPYQGRFRLTKDGPGGTALEIPGLEGKPWGYVAGTRLGKSYVSFYLMPVYVSSQLAATLSPELKRRMQGKACFNFTRVDEPLMAELERLMASGVDGYEETARQQPTAKR